MNAMTERQVAEIDRVLADNRVSNVCLSCGDKQLETDSRLHQLPLAVENGVPGAVTCAARICRHCGHVQHYALGPLDVDLGR